MSSKNNNDPEHDDIFSLLPWYVNQTLEEHQRAAVSRHVENCGECQREIQFLATLNDTVESDARNGYSLHADVDKDFASVMNRVDNSNHPINTASPVMSFLQRQLGEFSRFASALSVPQWGVTALASVFLAVFGLQLFYSQPEDDYSVLSSPAVNDTAMRLSVDVMPALDQEQAYTVIQQALNKLGQQTDIETGVSGRYTIVFRESVGVTELSKLVDELQSKPQINRVEILP